MLCNNFSQVTVFDSKDMLDLTGVDYTNKRCRLMSLPRPNECIHFSRCRSHRGISKVILIICFVTRIKAVARKDAANERHSHKVLVSLPFPISFVNLDVIRTKIVFHIRRLILLDRTIRVQYVDDLFCSARATLTVLPN